MSGSVLLGCCNADLLLAIDCSSLDPPEIFKSEIRLYRNELNSLEAETLERG